MDKKNSANIKKGLALVAAVWIVKTAIAYSIALLDARRDMDRWETK